MNERFNDRALRVVQVAEDEARRPGRRRVGADDLLRGLAIEREGVAGKVLESLGVDLDDLLAHLDEHRPAAGSPSPAGPLPLTDEAAKALQAATQEAVHLGRNYVGSEHILLGLLRVEGGAARILAQHGVNLNRASWRTQELLDHWQFGRRGAS